MHGSAIVQHSRAVGGRAHLEIAGGQGAVDVDDAEHLVDGGGGGFDGHGGSLL